jgi:hypothetical protein
MSSTPTAPGGLRPVTLTIPGRRQDRHDDPLGSFGARLVLPLRTVDSPAAPDLNAWTITHALGSPAGGTHTEVVFVDDSLASAVPTGEYVEGIADAIVRAVADELYARRWAFHYRPEQYVESVLRHGSLLRERVEVSAVEVWA